MQRNYEILPINRDHLTKVAETFSCCFGYLPFEGYFHRKFYDNPAGEVVGFAAFHEEDLAAFYGVIPEEYMVAGEKVIINQSMDTMTHPDYRRQGLFYRLIKETFDHLFERYGDFYVLGFPGSMSHGGLIKAGWKNIVDIPLIFVPRTVFKIKRIAANRAPISIASIDSFDDSYSAYFQKKVYPPNKITKYIDATFLNWRTGSHSAYNYNCAKITTGEEPIGLIIYRIDEKQRCFIQLLDFIDDEIATELVGEACDYLFRVTGCSYLYTFEPSEERLKRAFSRNWFIKNPFTSGPFSFRPPLSGYSNQEYVNGLNFFSRDSYMIQPIMRDY